jgi:hypothetical protein
MPVALLFSYLFYFILVASLIIAPSLLNNFILKQKYVLIFEAYLISIFREFGEFTSQFRKIHFFYYAYSLILILGNLLGEVFFMKIK